MKLGTIQFNPTKNTAQLKAREVGMAAQTFQSEKQLFDTVGQITGQLADKFSKIEQQEAQLEYKQKLLATEEQLASQDTFTKTDLLSMGLTELDKNVDWSKETFKSYEIQSAVMRQAMKDGVEDAVGKVGIPSYRGDLRRQLEDSNLNTMKALAADTAAQAEAYAARVDVTAAQNARTPEDLAYVVENSSHFKENPHLVKPYEDAIRTDQFTMLTSDVILSGDPAVMLEYADQVVSPEMRDETGSYLTETQRMAARTRVLTARDALLKSIPVSAAVVYDYDVAMDSAETNADAAVVSGKAYGNTGQLERDLADIDKDIEALTKGIGVIGESGPSTKLSSRQDQLANLKAQRREALIYNNLNTLPFHEAMAAAKGLENSGERAKYLKHVRARADAVSERGVELAMERGYAPDQAGNFTNEDDRIRFASWAGVHPSRVPSLSLSSAAQYVDAFEAKQLLPETMASIVDMPGAIGQITQMSSGLGARLAAASAGATYEQRIDILEGLDSTTLRPLLGEEQFNDKWAASESVQKAFNGLPGDAASAARTAAEGVFLNAAADGKPITAEEAIEAVIPQAVDVGGGRVLLEAGRDPEDFLNYIDNLTPSNIAIIANANGGIPAGQDAKGYLEFIQNGVLVPVAGKGGQFTGGYNIQGGTGFLKTEDGTPFFLPYGDAEAQSGKMNSALYQKLFDAATEALTPASKEDARAAGVTSGTDRAKPSWMAD